MIQDIFPKVYDPTYYADRRPKPESFLLYYDFHKILLKTGDPQEIPRFSDFSQDHPKIYEEAIYLFSIDEDQYFTVEHLDIAAEDGFVFEGQQIFRSFHPPFQAFAGVTGSQIYRWMRGHTYCGFCGTKMQRSDAERAMICPICKAVEYPKISVAIIVAIIDRERNRLLMTKNKKSIYPYYALVAGYIEIGETPEQAVYREVTEEVGISICNLKPYQIQPWSYSDTLMIGFTAELDGDPTLHIQEEELTFAGWFSPDEVPAPEFTISMGHELMLKFKEGRLN